MSSPCRGHGNHHLHPFIKATRGIRVAHRYAQRNATPHEEPAGCPTNTHASNAASLQVNNQGRVDENHCGLKLKHSFVTQKAGKKSQFLLYFTIYLLAAFFR